MINSSRLRGTALLCSVSLLALPQFALAQSAEEDAENDEIIVTATRDSRNLQDVPMSVDVVGGDQIHKFNLFDIKTISQLAPGVELTAHDPRKNTTTIRGIAFDPDSGAEPAVQVYLNNVPTDAQVIYTAMYDIGQIEVLRGPQGLLRGVSAPAGSITIATKRPAFDGIEGQAQATYTSRNGYNLQGGVSVPLSDTFAVRIAGLVDGNRANQVRNVNRGLDRSSSRTQSGRITLGWKPSDRFEAYLTYQYLNAKANIYQQVVGSGNAPLGIYANASFFGGAVVLPSIFVRPPLGPGPIPFVTNTAVRSGPQIGVKDYLGVTDGQQRVRNKNHILNLNMEYDMDWATLSFAGAYVSSRITTRRDNDFGNAVPGYEKSEYVLVPGEFNTEELRLHSEKSDGLSWSVGIFHTKRVGTVINDVNSDLLLYAVDTNSTVLAPNALFGLNPPTGFFPSPNQLPLLAHTVVPINSETWSFNGNLRYATGPFTVEGGLRYTSKKNIQTTQLQLIGVFNDGPREIIPVALQRTSYKPWTGGLSVSYKLGEQANIYASYMHSARAPTTGVAVPNGITNDLIRTQDEKTDSFEAGLKGTLGDRKIYYGLIGFYQKINGYISRFESIYYDAPANSPRNGTFGFNYNGNAKIYGVETTIGGRLSQDWDIGLNMAYAHARYSNARLPCNDFAGTGVPNQNGAPRVTGTGNVSYCVLNGRIAEVPDFSLNANTEVRFPMDNVTPYVSAMLSFRPGFFSERRQFKYQDQQIVNLFMGVRGKDDNWSITAFAKNLFNQRRITNISGGIFTLGATIQGTGAFNSGYRTINTTLPREFGLTLGKRF